MYFRSQTPHDYYELRTWVYGGALFDRIVEDGHLDEPITVNIVRQMLLGLQHLKRCSVLHRDLKPENLMMVSKAYHGLKIIDFGFACYYEERNPPRLMAGTTAYSAPETLGYENQHFATDLWSVAVIAFEILSGITPFEVPQDGPNKDRELTEPEVSANITRVRYTFDDDGIVDASKEAKDFISSILVKNIK
ncbi:unnamed protein product [Protopolystoma xenopodis]|uniref:Protein kinase domain-containing protein n=1 Tax=Protopolystoma xenopodis TaxID=117903 RepID=A0A448WBF8_9PLAT|nr:unnamed protein product [Protopolystoma xenopodis]